MRANILNRHPRRATAAGTGIGLGWLLLGLLLAKLGALLGLKLAMGLTLHPAFLVLAAATLAVLTVALVVLYRERRASPTEPGPAAMSGTA